jgi:hypothetical protein
VGLGLDANIPITASRSALMGAELVAGSSAKSVLAEHLLPKGLVFINE